MTQSKSMRAIVFSALMLIQVLAPITYAAPSSTPDIILETKVDLGLLSTVEIAPSGELANGWFDPEDGAGEINLLFRDMSVVSLEDWTDWTGQNSKLTGWYVLTHEFPVPSEWFHQLEEAGIDCFSFLPPNGFHCELQGHSVEQLESLEVKGLVQFDSADKIRENLVRGITGLEMNAENLFVREGVASANLVLSGESLPEGINSRDDLVLEYHQGRYATAIIKPTAIAWLAAQDEIEWIEERPWHTLHNDVADSVMRADQVWDSTIMAGIDSSWSGLDGSGIVVTVSDTGLDNGVNNSAMHPDLRDHIVDIVSFPMSSGWTTSCGASSSDDGAEDLDSGHGTHVAGSVLGDGTNTGGAIRGAAPEARLYMQATEQYCDNDNAYYLTGIPSDYTLMFEPAWDNGSRVHTNSWGSNVAGAYTSGSMQADSSARTYQNMTILFSAGNNGVDGNSDGEIDDDSLGSPATGKNVITVAAGENDRPSITSEWGGWWPSEYPSDPINSDRMANNSEGLAAFSSRGPTDDGRQKPDITAPGSFILSTKSRSTSSNGWGAYSGNSNYTFMGGTSMSCPLTAGAAALLTQHLIDNEGHSNPNSSLVKAIFTASARDMQGQYGSAANGAGEPAPNMHEGWGLVDLRSAVNATWIDGDSVQTNEERGWSFIVPPSSPDLRVALSWTDPASTPSAGTNLVNDLDLAVKDPSGTWTNLSNNLDNLRGLSFASPAQGSWEVHVLGTNIPTGPQHFALALNIDTDLVNLTEDMDFDGIEDDFDDCINVAGTSSVDRSGCPDTDGDGYSDPDTSWSIANGADAFLNEPTQHSDQDGDGYGDNAAGLNPDSCLAVVGSSSGDRFGCADSDMDTFSDPDVLWTVSLGADGCSSVYGTSTSDRNGCPDQDGDSFSDPDPSGTNGSVWLVSNGADAFVSDSTQWLDFDTDGYGDNPPPALNSDACPLVLGTSYVDRLGCVDADDDGYSDADSLWLAHPTGFADAFPNDPTQWLDSDGDGYGDNQSGNNPDACVNDNGIGDRSYIDRLGCPDSDEDGYSDADIGWPAHPIGTADAFPIDDTQWNDTDSDNYGDNATGSNPDACVSVAGTSSSDRKGCPDSDGDSYSDPDPLGNNGSVYTVGDGADVWPNEPTQWSDGDGDGYGDNPIGVFPDSCVLANGNSSADRYGCPDSDGDGYSDPDPSGTNGPVWTVADGADFAANDQLRWSDFDGDTHADQIDDDCPLYWGNSTTDRIGCPDTDGDGTSDPDPNWTPVGNGSDAFKTDPTQSTDSDGDGYGDNPVGNLADDCPNVYGESWANNTFGCVDTDSDGWADLEDAFINDYSQWFDSDGDGFGDNSGGTTPDACPYNFGNSTKGNQMGCPDSDGDGWDDVLDQLPDLAHQWLDQDGDGYGDNASGPLPDACPGVPGNSTIDRYGCVDDDGDGMSNESDSFPNDPTRSQDTDGDGFDDLEDDCFQVAGNSTIDRTACPDTDGDGYSDPTLPIGDAPGYNSSDGADALPLNPTQWADSDGDGYGDNASGTLPDACPSQEGYSNVGAYGCPDSDNDGTSESYDAFPDEPTQWSDIDGDGFGDNPNGTQPDNCSLNIGTSFIDVFGCPDADGDGASDINDLWVNDSTQWFDSDGDGYGDNADGVDGDVCPNEFGTADLGIAQGCVDSDADGYADSDDAFPNEPTQWVDVDGDGYGDNNTPGASRPDHWVDDPMRNVAESSISCTPENMELDLAGEDYFSFSCRVDSELSGVTLRVEWQPVSSIIAATSVHVLTFPDGEGLTQNVRFDGEGRSNGNFQMYVTVREPGVEFAMSSDTVNLVVFDSRIVDENDLISDQSSTLNNMLEMPIIQAMIGGLVLFFLMGMLIIRGNASKARLADERTEHAREIIAARLARLNNPQPPQLRQAFGVDGRVPPPPPPPRPPVP